MDEPKTEPVDPNTLPMANAQPSNRMIPGVGWNCPQCNESLRSEQPEMCQAVAGGKRVGPGSCPKCGCQHTVGRSMIVIAHDGPNRHTRRSPGKVNGST